MNVQLQRLALAAIFGMEFLMSRMAVADERESKLMTYLDDHGEWMTSSKYGPVWRPNTDAADGDWHPFLNGQWLYTDRGWFWESRDSFGWLTSVDLSGEPIEVEFMERFPTDEEARLPFLGGENIIAYAPRLDLEKAFAWVPGNLASLDAVLLQAERLRLAERRDDEREVRANGAIPRQPVYRVPESKPETVERVWMRELVREPVIIYEQVVNSPWYKGRPCQPNCECPKCRPRPPLPVPYSGNEAQREQVQRQFSAQEMQRERQRAAQERARRGRDPNAPRVPLGPGL